MTRWQKVEWDDEGNVIAPEFAVRHGATWPLLARLEHCDGTVGRSATNRYNLSHEKENYLSIHVAPIIWPEDI
jgi:hypothetical protein